LQYLLAEKINSFHNYHNTSLVDIAETFSLSEYTEIDVGSVELCPGPVKGAHANLLAGFNGAASEEEGNGGVKTGGWAEARRNGRRRGKRRSKNGEGRIG